MAFLGLAEQADAGLMVWRSVAELTLPPPQTGGIWRVSKQIGAQHVQLGSIDLSAEHRA
jgi:hypothetical protein